MSLHDALVTFASHQDYLWVLVILAWLAAAGLCRPAAPGGGQSHWIPAVGVLLALFALSELSLLATPLDPKPYVAWRSPWDAALGCLTFATAVLLGWAGARTRRARTAVVLAALAGLGAAAFFTRDVHPMGWDLLARRSAATAGPALRAAVSLPVAEITAWQSTLWARLTTATHFLGGLPLHLLLLLAAAGCARPPADRATRLALLCVLAGFWTGSAGPLADALKIPRSFTDLSLLGPWSAAWFFAGGVLLLHHRLQTLLAEEAWTAAEARRELRLLGTGLALWLGLGGLLAGGMGWLAQHEFENGALGRVQALALLIDADLVAREIPPDFHLDRVEEDQNDAGRVRAWGFSSLLGAGRLHAVEERLSAIERTNPDIRNATLVRLVDGYLASLLASARAPGARDELTLYRRATADDLAAWEQKNARFLPPEIFHFGEIAQALAPVVSREGRMLGWLKLSFGSSTWRAPATQARLQVFATVTLGAALFGVYFQLRVRSRRQHQLQLAALAAKEADRAKTSFLAQVSHELRTPIQSIMGYGELLARQPLAPEARRWLASIRAHGQLLTRLVNDLLDLSALQAGAFRLVPEPGNLAELMRAVVDSLQARAGAKGLRLDCVVAPDQEGVGRALDTERVRQLLLNLAGNAVKFTAQGLVRLELAAGPAPDQVEIRVTDSGPGIPPAEQARLFRPFSRLPAARHVEGAGLGLALSAGLCAAMQGRLAVASDGRTGTTFTAILQLPRAALPATPAGTDWVSLQGRRVLVADDNTLVRELFVTCLTGQGATCTTATDGRMALDLILAGQPDVVVLDISMPELDGLEVARQVKAHRGRSPRIVGVSAHADQAERARALQAGMDAFLVKPVALPALVAAVGATGGDRRPAVSHSIRLEDLRVIFAREAPGLRADILAAARAGDLDRLHSRIHYLRNSADIARYDELGLYCAQLETLLVGRGERFEAVLAEVDRVLVALGSEDQAPGDHP